MASSGASQTNATKSPVVYSDEKRGPGAMALSLTAAYAGPASQNGQAKRRDRVRPAKAARSGPVATMIAHAAAKLALKKATVVSRARLWAGATVRIRMTAANSRHMSSDHVPEPYIRTDLGNTALHMNVFSFGPSVFALRIPRDGVDFTAVLEVFEKKMSDGTRITYIDLREVPGNREPTHEIEVNLDGSSEPNPACVFSRPILNDRGEIRIVSLANKRLLEAA